MSTRGPTRRDLLGGSLFASLLALGARPSRASEQHFRLSARETVLGVDEPGAAGDLARALSTRVDALAGLDPAGFLTHFDRGTVSRTAGGRTVRDYEIVARDVELEVAPGIVFPAWTYNGSVPGPTLRCTEGDQVVIHFENRSISQHTLHFHGIHPASMDGVLEVVEPGDRFVYRFTAEPAGLHLYHCHVPPVHLHMNRGLYGTFLVDPRRSRPEATEMVLVSHGWDLDFDERNELYAYNGAANFYRDNPIRLGLGEPVRLYVVNALEFDAMSSFHLHANVFRLDRTGLEPSPREVTDTFAFCQGERAILEFVYDHPGRYMFHPHRNVCAEKGAMGFFEVAG